MVDLYICKIHFEISREIKETNIGVTFLGKWSFVSHRNTWAFKDYPKLTVSLMLSS